MTTLVSWVPVPVGSGFPVQNLPYGVFSVDDGPRRVGVAIGEHVLDVAPALEDPVFSIPSLNGFMAQGRAAWAEARRRLTTLLTDPAQRPRVESHLYPASEVRLHLPFEVMDYVDFYSSEQHATNAGRILRPDEEPLRPNWKHLPVGYHGRSGTIVVSGTPIVRPCGQRKGPADPVPTYGPSVRLDIETEVGFVVGTPSPLGSRVPTAAFRDYVFGVVLVNDWSARDIQAWEYVPLGPLLGKSFATSISPWVVTLEALEPAFVPGCPQDPTPLPYLRETERMAIDIELEVEWNGDVVSRPPFREMYWSPAQALAHLTVNGASLRTGDLYASGTVSGADRGQWGSCMELSWNGTDPIKLSDGSTRAFLEDGDTVTITGRAPGADGTRIGLGSVTGTIQPAA